MVGGYELLRQPASVIRIAERSGIAGSALPADGVVAREQRNEAHPKSATAVSSAVQNLVNRVDAERWFATMSTLAGFNRNSFSPALGAARDWISTHFEATGLVSSRFTFTLENLNCTPSQPPISIDNPIGFWLAADLAGRVGGGRRALRLAQCSPLRWHAGASARRQ